jgi:hypothetical protein
VARKVEGFPFLQSTSAFFVLLNDGYYCPPSVLANLQRHLTLSPQDPASLVSSSHSDPALSLARVPTHSALGVAGLVHMKTQLQHAHSQHRKLTAQLDSVTRDSGVSWSACARAPNSCTRPCAQLVSLTRHNHLLSEEIEHLSQVRRCLQSNCNSIGPQLLGRAKQLCALQTQLTRCVPLVVCVCVCVR